MGSLRPDEKFFTSEIFRSADGARAPAPDLGTWREAARDLPVHARCDVLVAGGGPSGTAAAVAAARQGADVILLERYNHLGGLSTGGLVIWIDRMTDWDGRSVIRGAGELRHKESDRIAGIVAGLVAMGARIEAVGDDIVIDGPTALRGAVVDSLGDHRLAMTFAIAGLVAGGATTVLGADSVAISYPTFFADLERIRS